jgi:hypothetical protein
MVYELSVLLRTVLAGLSRSEAPWFTTTSSRYFFRDATKSGWRWFLPFSAISRNGIRKGYLMSAAESFLKEARKSFRLAADSIRPKEIERYAGMGRDYLKLAQDAAKGDEKPAHPPTWWGP